MATGQNDVERHLRIAIDAAAARTGARISGADSSLVAMILSSLTPSELKTLADSPDVVLGKVASIVTQFADEDLKRQEMLKRTGQQGADKELGLGDDKMPRILHRRGAEFLDQLADRVSNEKGSSARYTDAGMAVPGNADARGFDIRNYYTSPVTRGLVDMGMTDKTFDYVRRHVPGASVNNIRAAARDAKALGFGPNDKGAIKDHTIIDKHDPAARRTNTNLQNFRKGLQESEEFRKAVEALEAAKTDEEKKRAMERINQEAERQAAKHGVKKDMLDHEKPDIVREAIKRRREEITKKEIDALRGVQPGSEFKPYAELKADPKLDEQQKAAFEALKRQRELKEGAPVTAKEDGGAPARTVPVKSDAPAPK